VPEAIEQTFTLQVPSSTRNLSMIRDFVTRVAEQSGLDEQQRSQLEMAVDEACANVIEHAYGEDVSREVVVRATFGDEGVEIRVIDTGKGFDPGAVSAKEVEQLVAERRRGGLGLRLMKALVDEVHYEIEPGKKNELRMVKRLRKG
jgi:serine/threonine-protein kinase RsbW